MGFRQFVKPRATELSAAQATNLGTVPVTSPTIQPAKSNGLNIVGMMIKISATVTQQTAAQAWNVGALIKELKFSRGSDVLIDINGEDQYEKVFHILTGLPIGPTFNSAGVAYFSNGSSPGLVGQSSATHLVYIPLHFTTQGLPLTITLTYNAYTAAGSNTTAATGTLQVMFFYSDMPVEDDRMKIVVAPTALNANTDIDISLQFSETRPVDEIWVELTADSSLNYETFKVGQTVLYDTVDPTSLAVQECPDPKFAHINGFLKQAIKRGTVFPTQGTQSSSKPILINNYSASQTPTFYLVLSSGELGVSASAPSQSIGGGRR